MQLAPATRVNAAPVAIAFVAPREGGRRPTRCAGSPRAPPRSPRSRSALRHGPHGGRRRGVRTFVDAPRTRLFLMRAWTESDLRRRRAGAQAHRRVASATRWRRLVARPGPSPIAARSPRRGSSSPHRLRRLPASAGFGLRNDVRPVVRRGAPCHVRIRVPGVAQRPAPPGRTGAATTRPTRLARWRRDACAGSFASRRAAPATPEVVAPRDTPRRAPHRPETRADEARYRPHAAPCTGR